MIRLEVYSHRNFDEIVKRMGLNDNNVEDKKDTAFISIIGTDECIKTYLKEDGTKHYFNVNHSNVLNLEFDDLEEDMMWKGHQFKTITQEQIGETLSFIDSCIKNGVTRIILHCRAGISRSRAIAEAIAQIYENEHEIDYSERNEYIPVLNQGVLRKIKQYIREQNEEV